MLIKVNEMCIFMEKLLGYWSKNGGVGHDQNPGWSQIF